MMQNLEEENYLLTDMLTAQPNSKHSKQKLSVPASTCNIRLIRRMIWLSVLSSTESLQVVK